MTSRPSRRVEQRRDTQARILDSARRLFAEVGYDRATIRAIAAGAETDPGLVMRYFGSKDNLFAQVSDYGGEEPVTGPPERAAELLLAALERKLAEEPVDALAAVRSMFTHPEAAGEVRAAMISQQRQAGQHLAAEDAEDADLRAGLIGALTIGTVIGRYLLQLDGLRDAPPERITALLRNAFHDLAHGAPRPEPHGAQ
ncbi:TetR family transcriptional regulator [Pseudonocardia eucalypti]|uniref:TetR family transcriptional regulator n=1 Tax=Pseudonocardia eucalypti TaxID=648755 RepID=A0ABP9QSU6_9PSEU|nr:AcrR family transcriptional regulator [Pseudonocardia eucalypti]